MFAEPAEGAVPGFDMELVGIYQGAVDVEDESAGHGCSMFEV